MGCDLLESGDTVPPEHLATELLRLPNTAEVEARPDGLWIDAPALDVRVIAQKMNELGAHFSTMTATALPNGETELIYHYLFNRQSVNCVVWTQGQIINSIAEIIPAADWIECEIQDLYNVQFRGNPNPSRLIQPPDQPPSLFRAADESEV